MSRRSLRESYDRATEAEAVTRWARLLLVRAATFEHITHAEVARELGVSQSAVTQQLAATKLARVRSLERSVLLAAAAPATRWLAGRRGFSAIRLVERCWWPQPQPPGSEVAPPRDELDDLIAAMFGDPIVIEVDEPPIDVLLEVPADLGHNDVAQLSGDLARLLRREVLMHARFELDVVRMTSM